MKQVSKGQVVTRDKKELAREFRKNMTTAEAAFWALVRNRGLGMKFRRQQVIDGFIVDFYCEELALVVEIDGGIHQQRKQEDDEREESLKKRGLRVVRFSNEEIFKNKESVIEKLITNLTP